MECQLMTHDLRMRNALSCVLLLASSNALVELGTAAMSTVPAQNPLLKMETLTVAGDPLMNDPKRELSSCQLNFC